jgi:hypothetical protein
MCINPKGMIGMPVTGRHVWGHAYGHDMGRLGYKESQGKVLGHRLLMFRLGNYLGFELHEVIIVKGVILFMWALGNKR